jgi:bacterioferritin
MHEGLLGLSCEIDWLLTNVPEKLDGGCSATTNAVYAATRITGRRRMQGDENVINELNAALSAELTAIVQYMTQSEMCNNWGYVQLGERTKARAIEEMKHAEGLIERIIFLDAIPSVDVGLKPRLGGNVQQQMQINLEDERDAVRQYNNAVKVCMKASDEGSRSLFRGMIQDEEGHVEYLEAQLDAIKEMGIANYLAQQLGGGTK